MKESIREEAQSSASGVWYFIGGALAGAAAALLFAPYSGEETREELYDISRRGKERAGELFDRIGRSIPGRVKLAAAAGAVKGGAREAFNQAGERVRDTFQS